jgi:D-beta-D-heptose 7-phosphate kinase/D-beta-D-heptose 1-phosphate adenosyltransferase
MVLLRVPSSNEFLFGITMNKLILDFIDRNQSRKLNIHCLGDAMIDQYYDVIVNRLSSESLAPVMLSNSRDYISIPGGVANVAYQFKNFGVNCISFCFDSTLQDIDVFYEHDLEVYHVTNNSYLPIKKRFVCNGQIIARHDLEYPNSRLTDDELIEATQDIKNVIREIKGTRFIPDVTVFSDYNKGFFNQESFIDMYDHRTIKIVDPKKGPLSKWKGCTIFKPNALEAYDLTGYTDWKSQSTYIQNEIGCQAVVITHAGGKVCGIDNDKFFEYIPQRQISVQSVVGAGDCFASFFAMAAGHGFSMVECVEIAWNAGASYVQRSKNKPLYPIDLVDEKIIDPKYLKNRDFKLVFTNGCFDGLTSAHVNLLKFAKKQGDKLVVALNSDQSIKNIKGEGRPILPLADRQEIMASLSCVDYVVSFEENTPLQLIEMVKPEIIIKGGDYKPDQVVGKDHAKVVIFDLMDTISTTEKIKKAYKFIKNEEIKQKTNKKKM